MPVRSTTVTATPRRARKYATEAPITPAPQTTTRRGELMVGSRLSRGRHRRRALPPDAARVVPGATLGNPRLAPWCPRQRRPRSKADRARVRHQVLPDAVGSRGRAAVRSEERRVGKEWRSRGRAEPDKKRWK